MFHEIDNFDLFIGISAFILMILGFYWVNSQSEINKEIIKKSEEYTIFSDCTEIQGKYYCK